MDDLRFENPDLAATEGRIELVWKTVVVVVGVVVVVSGIALRDWLVAV
jgi:hypothetical protein